MKFPGSNKLELNMSATKELIAAYMERTFAAQGVRITNVAMSGSYSAKTLDVTFTTDPDPDEATAPPPSRPRVLSDSTPETPPSASPREDDDGPF